MLRKGLVIEGDLQSTKNAGFLFIWFGDCVRSRIFAPLAFGTNLQESRRDRLKCRADGERTLREGADIVQPKELQGSAGSLPEIQS